MAVLSLTKMHVFQALKRAISPDSIYVNGELLKMGFHPASGLTLRYLRELEKDGRVKCVGGPNGLYGFRWEVL